MTAHSRGRNRPRDPNQLAKFIVDVARTATERSLRSAPRIALRPAVLATLLLLSCPATVIAEEPPRFNIEATCRAAPALLPQDRNPYDACMRDEQNARARLDRRWASVDPEHRRLCAAETKTCGGHPSYVEVLTCIDMYAGSAPTPMPRQRRD